MAEFLKYSISVKLIYLMNIQEAVLLDQQFELWSSFSAVIWTNVSKSFV